MSTIILVAALLILLVAIYRFQNKINILQKEVDLTRRKEAYLRSVLDTDPNFIFAKNRIGEFTLVNESVARAYGTKADDLLGRTDADFNNNPEEVEHFRNDDLQVMDQKIDKFIALEKITTAEGQEKWLQTIKRPLIDDRGNCNEVLGVSTDVTKRKLVENELEFQNRQMENILFAISHDLKSPLVTIKGYLPLLNQAIIDRDEKKHQQYTNTINRSIDLISDLIHRILQLAETGNVEDQVEVIDVSQLVDEICGNYSKLYKNYNIKFNIECILPLISFNRTYLFQIFDNLIANAVKYACKIDDNNIITVDYLDGGNEHCFLVKDRGQGIKDEDKSKIFDIFYRNENLDNEGSGLGLSIVSKILKTYRGNIWVEDNPAGKGSVFKFTIPKEIIKCKIQQT